MKKKIKELLKTAAKENENKTVMEALITFLVASVVVIAVIYRKEIKKLFKKEEPKEPPFEPLPKPEPEEPEPTKPEEKNFVIDADFTGTPIEIPATDQNSFVSEEGDEPFTLRALLDFEDKEGLQWIASKRDSNNREYELIIYKDNLAFIQYDAENKPIGRGIPISELPEEAFLLHIDSTGNKSTDGFIWTLNGREIETEHLFDSTYKGMVKTDASVFIGKAGFNENYPFNGTAKISIEKRLWSAEEKLNDYKEAFGIEYVFMKPNEDGNYYIDVEPNTGEDVSIALTKAVEQVPNGTPEYPSDIILKAGRYNVDRKHIPGYVRGGGLDMYARKFLRFSTADNKPAIFYVTSPAVEPFPLVKGKTNLTGKRCHIMFTRCEGIEFENIQTEGTYRKGSFLGSNEFEHAIYSSHSKNIKVKNYKAEGIYGDGFYGWHTDGIELENIKTNHTNRQGVGFSNGCKNIVIDGHEADNCQRASEDFEPQHGGIIDGVEIKNCNLLDGHIAAGGSGEINNFHFHHNKHRSAIKALGISSYPRKNWTIEDNEEIGAFGSTGPFITIKHTYGVKLRRNKYPISKNQARWAALFVGCGDIEAKENDFLNESLIILEETIKDSKVSIEKNTPEGIVMLDKKYADRRGMEQTQEPIQITYNQ